MGVAELPNDRVGKLTEGAGVAPHHDPEIDARFVHFRQHQLDGNCCTAAFDGSSPSTS